MNFNSLAFLIYLPIVVAVHWLLPHRWRKYWLLAASYFFYMYWDPLFILLILFSTAVDYLCSLGMERRRDKPGIMKALLLASVCMNLGLLFFFKYWDFFGETVNSLCAAASIPYRVPALNLILPVGISFYTFQTMSYTIDVYRGDQTAERDPVSFALFVTYFPQLVAGPIEKPADLLPQLKAEKRFSWDDLAAGLRIALCGFFRKCAVADVCGVFVNRVFAGAETANSLAIACAGGLSCIQMYCDFAGYSEIAAGCARMMGVRLMRNFDRPYLAQSYTEFFRRWHISLNRWFTSYLYIPLGRLARRCVMFVIFIPAALIFRAGSVEQLGLLLARLFTQTGFGADYCARAFESLGMDALTLAQAALSIVCMAKIYRLTLYDLTPSQEATAQAQRTASYAYLILAVAMSWLTLLTTQDAVDFAYFQF